MNKILVGSALSLAMLVGSASAAWANHCANLSRTAGDTALFTEKGRWFLVPIPELGGATWVFGSPDNFMNGQGDALLDNATCPAARLTAQIGDPPSPANLKGIWSESCAEKAGA